MSTAKDRWTEAKSRAKLRDACFDTLSGEPLDMLYTPEDGTVPEDNPFWLPENERPAGSTAHTVWSYGHRTGQGLDGHPITGEIWNTEMGPRGGDEINRIQAGGNYGGAAPQRLMMERSFPLLRRHILQPFARRPRKCRFSS